MGAFLDRCAAWALRTVRSLGFGVAGNLVVMAAFFFALLAVMIGMHALLVLVGVGRRGAGLATFPVFVFPLVVFHRVTVIVARLTRAAAAHDASEIARLKRLIDGEGPPRNDRERAMRILGEAETLLVEERWPEARDLFASIDAGSLLELVRPGVQSELGFATAHAGQPDLGVERIEAAIAMAEAQASYPKNKRWYLDWRLAIALSLAGRHDDAAALHYGVLDDFVGDAREWTQTMYFLAQSERALGAMESATGALEAAAEEGDGPFAARASAALEMLTAMPHRGGLVVREPAEPSATREPSATSRRAEDEEDEGVVPERKRLRS